MRASELPAAAPSARGFWLEPPASQTLWRRKGHVWFFSPGVCYFLVVIITDRAQPSSATPGCVAGDILQWWVPRVAKCLLVK